MAGRSSPRSVEFAPAAEAEYLEALRYYEREGRIGASFEAAVRRGVAMMLRHPEASPVVTSEGGRRRVLGRFPFSLYYTVEGDVVRIHAVAHQKRRPFYWADRA